MVHELALEGRVLRLAEGEVPVRVGRGVFRPSSQMDNETCLSISSIRILKRGTSSGNKTLTGIREVSSVALAASTISGLPTTAFQIGVP